MPTLRRVLSVLPLALLAVTLLGCPDPDPDPEPTPEPTPAEPETQTYITYNAGLAVGFVGGADDRAPNVTAAIAELDADVICLQEIWNADHVAMMEEAAADPYPYTWFPAPQQETGTEPACTTAMLQPLTDCLDSDCGDLCADDLVDCILDNCLIPFFTLSRDCNRCVQANVGEDPTDVFQWCTEGIIEFAYHGSFGTGLISQHEMTDIEEHVFFSTTNRRSVIHAVVNHPEGAFDVYCTHLTAVFDIIPYPREEGTWAAEQEAQILDLIAYVEASASTGRTVVLGDFNTGPDGDGYVADVGDHYTLLKDQYGDSPYLEQGGACTYCPDNVLNGTYPDGDGVLIDHVFLDGIEGTLSSERILDGPLTVERCGIDIEANYSDHYGVSVTVTQEETE
jgi:endonuclease/exonuclease/phosphatase family metal-dependent hydrolase